jgi:hypothetical protein
MIIRRIRTAIVSITPSYSGKGSATLETVTHGNHMGAVAMRKRRRSRRHRSDEYQWWRPVFGVTVSQPDQALAQSSRFISDFEGNSKLH